MSHIIEISNFDAPELDIYARNSENQLVNRANPKQGMFIAESPRVIERALDTGYEPVSCLVEKRQLEGEAKEILKRLGDIPVYTAEMEVLAQLTGFKLTRGMLCAMYRKALPSVRERPAYCHSGKCGKPYECGRYFPFRGCPSYGCGAFDLRLQQSPLPPGGTGQYGNGVSDSLDLFRQRGVAGKRNWNVAGAWL